VRLLEAIRESGLAPRQGTFERYRLQEWLNHIATDIHKGLSPLWNPKTPQDYRSSIKDTMAGRFELLQKHLQNRQFLLGDRFTVADAYLFTILAWTKALDIDLTRWPTLKAYFDRVGERPAVKAALEAEAAARKS